MTGKLRTGVFGTFATYEALELYFDTVVDQSGGTAGDQNVLHLAILDTAMGGRFNDDKYVLLSLCVVACGVVWWYSCCVVVLVVCGKRPLNVSDNTMHIDARVTGLL
jgi:hypothetical protein